jgi:hypothetical protein
MRLINDLQRMQPYLNFQSIEESTICKRASSLGSFERLVGSGIRQSLKYYGLARAELSGDPCGIVPPVSLLFFFWSLEEYDGANPPSWRRRLGFGPTPAPGREGWDSRDSETASPASARGPVH